MWYPDKAAFRAGYVDGAQWNRDSIGPYSVAAGYSTKATAFAAVAMGFQTTAGHASTAFGFNTIASGSASTAMGLFTVASGHQSTATGYSTVASGVGSTSMGYWTNAKAYCSLAMGLFNDNTDNAIPDYPRQEDRIFQIGNGTDVSARSNALTVLRDGNTGIGTTTPQARLEVNGYTMLGSSAPKIQMIKITGTTAASQGSAVSFVHGLTSSKILSVELLIEYTSNSFIHASYRSSPGYEVNFFFTATHIFVENVVGNSSAVVSKPLKLLITYEE